MGRQLDLFAQVAVAGTDPATSADDALSPQRDLFDGRAALLNTARNALYDLEPVEVFEEIAAMRARYPNDPTLLAEAARLASIAERVEAALESPPSQRAERLVGIATHELAPDLVRALQRRAAIVALSTLGDRALLAGRVPAWWLLHTGDIEDARGSIRCALAASRTADFIALAGDALSIQGRSNEARWVYLEALLVDPHGVAFADVHDTAVSALPDVARYDLAIEDDPIAWSAAAGAVTGVFVPTKEAQARLPLSTPSGDAPETALQRCRRFVEVYPTARGSALLRETIEARRELKRLAPALFEAFMSRAGRR